jgi:hypothetical protein
MMQIEIEDALAHRIQTFARKQALPCNVVIKQLLEIGLEAKEPKAKPRRRKTKPADWITRAADRAEEMPRATTLKKVL